jgi:hypothetical protein
MKIKKRKFLYWQNKRQKLMDTPHNRQGPRILIVQLN